MASRYSEIITVFCLLSSLLWNGLSSEVEAPNSQSSTRKKFTAEDGSEVPSHLGQGRLDRHHGYHPHRSLSFPPDTAAEDDVSEEKDEEDDAEVDERVEFIAVISKGRNRHQIPCRRQKHRPVKFDTITTTSQHYSPHTATFTVPYDGIYIFSVKILLHQEHFNDLSDLHIVTDKGKTVVCSISSQNGDTSENFDGLDSLLLEEENVDTWDHFHSGWGFEDQTTQGRVNGDWDKPAMSLWEKDLRKETAEGECEGVKHFRRGQKVFVRSGNVEDDVDLDDFDDDDDDIDDDHHHHNEVGLCDIISGVFSGSLLTIDI